MPDFASLKDEYARLWATMQIKPEKLAAVDKIARKLIGHKDEYETVEAETGVPWFVIAGLHNRESDADFNTYLGNGDSLDSETVHVPKGRGPFSTWHEGAIDALKLDGLDRVKDWGVPRACYMVETFNGFGPRMHGINSGYLWSFTNHYIKGKYVKDGPKGWDPNHVDQQCGAMPIIKRIMEFEGLSFGKTNPIKGPATVALTGGILAAIAQYFDAPGPIVAAVIIAGVAAAAIYFAIARS